MLKTFRGLLGLNKPPASSSNNTTASKSSERSWLIPTDWIEPEVTIAEAELNIKDLPVAAGAFARHIVGDAIKNELELPIMP